MIVRATPSTSPRSGSNQSNGRVHGAEEDQSRAIGVSTAISSASVGLQVQEQIGPPRLVGVAERHDRGRTVSGAVRKVVTCARV